MLKYATQNSLNINIASRCDGRINTSVRATRSGLKFPHHIVLPFQHGMGASSRPPTPAASAFVRTKADPLANIQHHASCADCVAQPLHRHARGCSAKNLLSNTYGPTASMVPLRRRAPPRYPGPVRCALTTAQTGNRLTTSIFCHWKGHP